MTTITIGSQTVAQIAGYLNADQTGVATTATTQTTQPLSQWGGMTAGVAMKANAHNCLSNWWTAFSAQYQGYQIDTSLIKARFI